MPLGMEVGLGPGNFVLVETQLPPEWDTAPQFSAHVYCGQMAGWMKTPLGTEVDLRPGHIVLDGVPALCEKGTAAPLFDPCLLLSSCCNFLQQISCLSTLRVAFDVK